MNAELLPTAGSNLSHAGTGGTELLKGKGLDLDARFDAGPHEPDVLVGRTGFDHQRDAGRDDSRDHGAGDDDLAGIPDLELGDRPGDRHRRRKPSRAVFRRRALPTRLRDLRLEFAGLRQDVLALLAKVGEGLAKLRLRLARLGARVALERVQRRLQLGQLQPRVRDSTSS